MIQYYHCSYLLWYVVLFVVFVVVLYFIVSFYAWSSDVHCISCTLQEPLDWQEPRGETSGEIKRGRKKKLVEDSGSDKESITKVEPVKVSNCNSFQTNNKGWPLACHSNDKIDYYL